MNFRMDRLNGEMQKNISDIINNKIKDPRVAGKMISVLSVNCAKDLKTAKVYLSIYGDRTEAKKAFEIVTELRHKGIICELDHMGRGIKAQFKYADKIGAKYVGVIGSQELADQVVKIKNMTSGEEQAVAFKDVYDYISKL